MKKIVVKNCDECPLTMRSKPDLFCMHPDIGGRSIAGGSDRLPHWCPLEEEIQW